MASLLSLTALGAGCGSSSTPPRPPARLVVVSSSRTGRDQIWLLNADDGQEVRLTHARTTDDYPAFSPNGRQIAWVRVTNRKSDDADIWVMNADGTDPHRVARNASATSTLAWSHDGRHLYYASGDEGIDGLEVAGVDGGRDIHLGAALTSVDAIDPSWSPDGRQIAFEETSGPTWQMYVADAKGVRAKRVPGTPVDTYAIAWSPDGRMLATVVENKGTSGIYVVPVDGGKGRYVYRGSVVDGLTWTPDGSHVVFTAIDNGASQLEQVPAGGGTARPYLGTLTFDNMPGWQPRATPVRIGPVTGEIAYAENGEIYEMHPDGDQQTRLTTPPHSEVDHDPSWSPDGRSIAFVRTKADGGTATWSEVWLMNADGSDQRRLSHEPGYDVKPSWSGAHRVVYYDTDSTTHTDLVREAGPGTPARTVVSRGFFAEAAPDGHSIAYVARGAQRRIDVYAANLDGSHKFAVGGGPLIVYELAWSPDSGHIAFTAGPSAGKTTIYVAAVDGTSFVRLTASEAGAVSPAWSPDGATVAYVRPATTDKHLLLICERPVTGGTEHIVARVRTTDFTAPHLQWLADGSLGFSVRGHDGEEFHEVTQSGKVGPDLLANPASGSDPDWQPAPPAPSGPSA